MTDNPYAERTGTEFRYEIVDSNDGLFRYAIYRYVGEAQYPFGTLVTVAATRWGARLQAKRDATRQDRHVVETLYA